MNTDPLAELADSDRAFALIARSGTPEVEYVGCDAADLVDVASLAEIPLSQEVSGAPGPRMLALVPFAQVHEIGYAAHADDTPLRCLPVRRRRTYPVAEVLDRLPDVPLEVSDGGFATGDEEYAAAVKRIVVDEIGRGEGANFVIRRDYEARTARSPRQTALTLFRRLLAEETGAYWTFVVVAGDQVMVGATPERHVAVEGGRVHMNPISGTYRYPAGGPTLSGLLDFLADEKETDELTMVVDEELKQMSAVCDRGGTVVGPYLHRMGHLAHTAYDLVGTTDRDVREVLKGTMFAATVTGSPIENACRVIAEYEPTGRGYYGAVLALFGEDAEGRRTVDAPILIRTAYAEPDGDGARLRIPVGATLVRHSTPDGEVAETKAKLAGVLRALEGRPSLVPAASAQSGLAQSGLAQSGSAQPVRGAAVLEDPAVEAALSARNDRLAPFWLRPQRDRADGPLGGRRVRIVDAEDAWTQMLAHLMRRLGATVEVRRWDTVAPVVPVGPAGTVGSSRSGSEVDLLVAGPGPGDPRELDEPRIAALEALIRARLASGRPLLAVCLSHQVLAGVLGFEIAPLEAPYQGKQRMVDVFGAREPAGFYNTFVVRPGEAGPANPGYRTGLELSLHEGEVTALRGRGFVGVQFHLESVLTTRGVDLLAELAESLLSPGAPRRPGRS